jgi:hypothetical protein
MIAHYDMITGEEIASEYPISTDPAPQFEAVVPCPLAIALDQPTHPKAVALPACIVAMLPVDVLVDSAGRATNRLPD